METKNQNVFGDSQVGSQTAQNVGFREVPATRERRIFPRKAKGNDSFINVSPNNPTKGYIMVHEEPRSIVENGFPRVSPGNQALIRGDIKSLEQILKAELLPGGQGLRGLIVVKEYLESDLPTKTAQLQNVAKFQKKAGNTGIVLSVNGEPIYRFSEYYSEPSDKTIHRFVDHDNSAEVSEAAIALAAAEAQANQTPTDTANEAAEVAAGGKKGGRNQGANLGNA